MTNKKEVTRLSTATFTIAAAGAEKEELQVLHNLVTAITGLTNRGEELALESAKLTFPQQRQVTSTCGLE